MYDHKCLLENQIIQLNYRTVVSTGTNTDVPELEINMTMDGVRKRCRNNDIKDV